MSKSKPYRQTGTADIEDSRMREAFDGELSALVLIDMTGKRYGFPVVTIDKWETSEHADHLCIELGEQQIHIYGAKLDTLDTLLAQGKGMILKAIEKDAFDTENGEIWVERFEFKNKEN